MPMSPQEWIFIILTVITVMSLLVLFVATHIWYIVPRRLMKDLVFSHLNTLQGTSLEPPYQRLVLPSKPGLEELSTVARWLVTETERPHLLRITRQNPQILTALENSLARLSFRISALRTELSIPSLSPATSSDPDRPTTTLTGGSLPS